MSRMYCIKRNGLTDYIWTRPQGWCRNVVGDNVCCSSVWSDTMCCRVDGHITREDAATILRTARRMGAVVELHSSNRLDKNLVS